MKLIQICIALITLSTMMGNSQTIQNMELLASQDVAELVNDVWGYEDDTGTYIVMGSQFNSFIYELNRDSLIERARIPGQKSVWRDFKHYGHYVYGIADEGHEGLTIIDMSTLADSLQVTRWTGPYHIDNTEYSLNRCHNIFIDTRGYAYLAGCNAIGGIIILDIATDPLKPQLAGFVNEFYSHDAIVQDNRLYSSEIYAGQLSIYDVSDVSQPQTLASVRTSSTFTHNAWPSDDSQYIFTTDEVGKGYVDAYDISDLDQIELLDQYQPSDNPTVLPHNTHYHEGFLITSWYVEGVIVIDAHRPHNLIKVAQYDTNPQNNWGAWGAFPYTSEGLIYVSDMDNGLFVLRPQYRRAAYLEGYITDFETGNAVNGVEITLITQDSIIDYTNAAGFYATGAPYTGNAQLVVTHPDYPIHKYDIQLVEGELTPLDIILSQTTTPTYEIVTHDIKLWPNPSRHFIKIEIPSMTDVEINIIDGEGRVVRRQKIKKSEVIPINTLPSGKYMLEMLDKNGNRYLGKFIKS